MKNKNKKMIEKQNEKKWSYKWKPKWKINEKNNFKYFQSVARCESYNLYVKASVCVKAFVCKSFCV